MSPSLFGVYKRNMRNIRYCPVSLTGYSYMDCISSNVHFKRKLMCI